MNNAGGGIILFNNRYAQLTRMSTASLEGRTLLDVVRTRNLPVSPEAFVAEVVEAMRQGNTNTRVIETADGVAKFKTGDAVMWVQTAPCGACAACRSGRENLCERLTDDMALGAYADELVLAKKIVERNVFLKPVNLTYIEAAFLEPLACVVHGWNVLRRLGPPRDVAIVGAGTIGMLHLQYAARAGIEQVRNSLQGQLSAMTPAEQASDAGNSLKARISQLDTLIAAQTGQGQLIQPATTPTAPSSPKTKLDVAVGAYGPKLKREDALSPATQLTYTAIGGVLSSGDNGPEVAWPGHFG